MGIKTITEVIHTDMKKMAFVMGRLMVVTWGGLSLMLSIGCVSQVRDMSGVSPYKDLIGMRYELAEDSYVVTLKEIDGLYLVNQFSSFRLPYPVDVRNIGKNTRELNIKGVVLKGATLRVVAIQGVDSFDAGSSVDYFLEAEGGALKLRLNSYYLEDRKGAVYELNERSFLKWHADSKK